jgi:hypothetical protein
VYKEEKGETITEKKLTHLLVPLMMICLVAIPLTAPYTQAQETPETYIEKSFSWDYAGHHWNWNLSIPTEIYETYKAVPLYQRTRDGPSGYGFLTTTKDPYIQMLAAKLNQTTTELGYGAYDQVSFVLAFVQSLPYTSDNVTEGYNEYPRFPIETLVDDGGDCEDTSILFATITLTMGYGTVYLNPTGHYAVGILGSGIQGTSWEHPEGTNRTYYYCETTGDNYKIGQLPLEFMTAGVYIYDIDEDRQYVPEIVVYATSAPTPTKAAVMGSATPTPLPTSDGDDIVPQTPMPLSFNLVERNPAAFVLVLFAIVGSVMLAIWSVRKPHVLAHSELSSEKVSPLQNSDAPTQTDGGDRKYCIHCGTENKIYAAYCNNCGKQVND